MITTLYLNVPEAKVNSDDKRSYRDTLRAAIGNGYAIPLGDAHRCLPNCRVVLLCQERRQRAEGTLKLLEETGEKTGSGMLRYDVHMTGLVEVSYNPPPSRLRHTGILVTDE